MARKGICFVVVSLWLLALPAAAQQAPVYTYVAQFDVPFAHWAKFTTFAEETARPVFERLMSDGTIVGWSSFATEVHVQNGITHGFSWSATSIAGIEHALEELRKLSPIPELVEGDHYDLLLRSLVHGDSTAGPTSGYLWVTHVQVQPGRGREWRNLWEEYLKPVYDDLLADGTILAYNLAAERVHTRNPRWRFVAIVTPNAEALDKANAAFAALNQKNPTLRAALGRVTVRSEHRDFFARLLHFAHK